MRLKLMFVVGGVVACLHSLSFAQSQAEPRDGSGAGGGARAEVPTNLSLEAAKQELDRLRVLIEDLNTAIAFMDDRLAQAKEEGAEESEDTSADEPSYADRVKKLLAAVAALESRADGSELPMSEKMSLAVAESVGNGVHGTLESLPRPISLPSRAADMQPKVRTLIRNAMTASKVEAPTRPRIPEWKTPELRTLGELLYSMNDMFWEEEITLARMKHIAAAIRGAGGVDKTAADLIERHQQLQILEKSWKALRLDWLSRSIEAVKKHLETEKKAMEDRVPDLAGHIEKLQTKNLGILQDNLLYLLIGMMIVIVVMIIVLAAISNRSLATSLVEQRTLVELAGLTFLLSVVLLLASSQKIEAATTGTLLGTMAGYILSRKGSSDRHTDPQAESRRAGQPVRTPDPQAGAAVANPAAGPGGAKHK
jgi:hypothetical protein